MLLAEGAQLDVVSGVSVEPVLKHGGLDPCFRKQALEAVGVVLIADTQLLGAPRIVYRLHRPPRFHGVVVRLERRVQHQGGGAVEEQLKAKFESSFSCLSFKS